MPPANPANPTAARWPHTARLRVAAAFDGDGPVLPGAGPLELLLRWPDPAGPRVEVLALRPAAAAGTDPFPADAPLLDRSACVLIPGLINAHTHLDLTALGPQPHDPADGFVAWINRVRAGRLADPAAIAASVRRGVELSRAGGTVLVGDIAGAVGGKPSRVALDALAATGLPGISFIEYFGLATPLADLMAMLKAVAAPLDGPLRVGIQPHAPYTVSLAGYTLAAQAAALGIPVSTHVAESLEERELIVHARGPFKDLLAAALGDPDRWLAHFGVARSPVAHFARVEFPVGRASSPPDAPRPLVAHVNDCDDADLDLLARAGAIVVYCPRASAYFAAEKHFGPHRYRDMLAAGIPVALGTDSLINLPPAAADPAAGGMSILDEMRLLHRRDGTDASTLLAMATLNPLDAFPHVPVSDFRLPCRNTALAGPLNTLAGLLAVPIAPGVAPADWLTAAAGSAPPEVLQPPVPGTPAAAILA